MRKAAVSLAVGLVLVLAALGLGPRLVDLDRYRPQVAERLSEMLGREVVLSGPIDLSLLPNPHVTARDVRIVGSLGAGATEMMRVRQIDAQLAFWPLLLGRLDVTSARLIQPTLTVDMEAGGDSAEKPRALPRREGEAGSIFGAGAGMALGARSNIKIAAIAIEDGTLVFRKVGVQEAAEHVNMQVTGDVVSGPLRVRGNFTAEGATLSVSAEVSRFDRDNVPVSLAFEAPTIGSATVTGEVVPESDGPTLHGKLALAGADFGALSTLAGIGPAPPMLKQPLHLSGDISASTKGFALDGLSIDLGDIHGSGAVKVLAGTPLGLAVRFQMNSFDLDRFLSERAAAVVPSAPAAGQQTMIALPREPALGGALRFSLPSGITAQVDLGIDAVLWRQSAVRQVRLDATLDDGKLVIAHLKASLPGGSDVAISGTLETIAALPRFSGSIDAGTDNLRDLLRWTGIAVGGVPEDRLRRATFASTLEAEANTIEARSIDIAIDATHVSGAATIALRNRVAIGARLAIDQLNLDAYFGEAAAAAPGAAPAGDAAPAGGSIRVTVPGVLSQALANVDANLDAGVETFIWQNQPIRVLHFVGTLQNRDLTIRELSVGDLGGATGKLSGYMQAIGGAEPKTEVALEMHGPEFGRVLRLLAPRAASGDTFGEFTLGLELKRELGRLTIDGDLDAMGGKLHVAGSAPQPDTWDMTLNLQHPSFNRLMRLALPNYRPQGGELGAVRFEAGLEWAPARIELRDIDLRIADMTLGGDLRVTLAARPALTGDLLLGDLALDRLLPARLTASLDPVGRDGPAGVVLAQAGNVAPRIAVERWSRAPLDLSFLRLFDAQLTVGGRSLAWGHWRLGTPHAKLALKDAVLDASELSGQLFGGTLSASATINVAAAPNLDMKFRLEQAELAQLTSSSGVSRIQGKVDAQSVLHTTGTSSADFIGHLSGTAEIRGGDGRIEGIDLPAINQRIGTLKGLGDLGGLLRAGTAGSTGFSVLAGNFTIKDGVARSDSLRLVADGGEGNGTLTLDLPGWSLSSHNEIRLTGISGAPPLGLNLAGPLDQPNWSLDLAALSKTLADRLLDRAMQPGADQAGGQAPAGSDAGDGSGHLKPRDILRNLFKSPQPN